MAASLQQQLVANKASLSAAKVRIEGLSDSVATLSRRLDSLTASAHTNPVEVRVSSPLDVRDTGWDIAGVIVVPVVIVVLTAIFSARSAIQGAREGGRQTRQASTEAIREEFKLERRHALLRLRRRVTSNLRRLQDLRERTKDHDASKPFDAAVAEDLEIVWNRYYQVSAPIFELTTEALAERIERLFADAHSIAETVKHLEAQVRQARLETNSSAANVINTAGRHRDGIKQRISNLGANAAELAGALPWTRG